MSWTLRLVLIVTALLIFYYVLRKIRKSQLRIDDAIFWLFTFLLILILSIFPNLALYMANLLGVESPANFVFLVIIFILLIKLFSQSLVISQLRNKLESLVQKYAIDKKR